MAALRASTIRGPTSHQSPCSPETTPLSRLLSSWLPSSSLKSLFGGHKLLESKLSRRGKLTPGKIVPGEAMHPKSKAWREKRRPRQEPNQRQHATGEAEAQGAPDRLKGLGYEGLFRGCSGKKDGLSQKTEYNRISLTTPLTKQIRRRLGRGFPLGGTPPRGASLSCTQ